MQRLRGHLPTRQGAQSHHTAHPTSAGVGGTQGASHLVSAAGRSWHLAHTLAARTTVGPLATLPLALASQLHCAQCPSYRGGTGGVHTRSPEGRSRRGAALWRQMVVSRPAATCPRHGPEGQQGPVHRRPSDSGGLTADIDHCQSGTKLM